MKPGRRVASPRSMTRAPGGAAPVPTDTIRSPRTTTVAPSLSVVPVASNTCAALSTMISAGAGASAESTGVSAPATKQLKPASIGIDLVRFIHIPRSPSGGVLDREAGERGETGLIRGVGQCTEGGERPLELLAREALGVVEAAGGLDRRHHRVELLEAPLLDGTADRPALRLAAALQRADGRQRRLAFGKIVAQVLAALLGVRAVVEHVVDQLVRGAEVPAVGGERALHGRLGEREHRGDLRPGLEELGGVAVDYLEAPLFGRVRIVVVPQLAYFALGDDVGGVGHDLHDRLTAERGHHLEGARVDEVTDQHARRVAEHLVRGMPAAPQR